MVGTSVETWVERFAEAVIRRDHTLMDGDGRSTRGYAKKVVDYWDKIVAYGDTGREALATLLDHPYPNVRVAAAAFLLRYKTEKAISVLEDAAKGQSLTAFGAQECLKRWQEGSWQLDPEPSSDQ